MANTFDEDKTYELHFDMLKDDNRRNLRFKEAIHLEMNKIVQKKTDKISTLNVLDLGTGTGLLSMLVLEAAAQRNLSINLTAIDIDPNMISIAKQTIARNGFDPKRINFISKSSLEISNEDISNVSFDLIVSELLDSQLIGEGLLKSMRHATSILSNPKNVVLIPNYASFHATLVQSSRLLHRHSLKFDNSVSLQDTVWYQTHASCRGLQEHLHTKSLLHSPFDVETDVVVLGEIQNLFEFDFHELPAKGNYSKEVHLTVDRDGIASAFVIWWQSKLGKKLMCECMWGEILGKENVL